MNKRIIYLLFLFWILFPGTSQATLYRGAEITYTYIGNSSNPYKYGITVRTCTKTSSLSDRPVIELEMGDGSDNTLPRIQIIPDSSGFDSQQNIYYGEHTYPGPGVYELAFYDANRVQGIINIPGSVNEPICITATLVISPFFISNNSVHFNDYPCPAFACVTEPFCYTIPAFDPDGDSLSFDLLPCAGDQCDPIGGYQFPDAFGGSMTFDTLTGEFCWDAPQLAGEYNILINIHEWKNIGNGNYIEAGTVMRDMQLHVLSFCSMGIEEEIFDTVISVFPNPFTDYLVLSTQTESNFSFEIYNSIGEIILTGNFDQFLNIDGSEWANGMYFIRYSNGGISGCRKLVKE